MIGTPLCEHIAHYYPGIIGEPIFYWEVPADQIPAETHIVATPSDTGDTCHRELRGLTAKQSKKFFQQQRLRFENFRVCQDSVPVNFRPA